MASAGHLRWWACTRKLRYESAHVAKHVAWVMWNKSDRKETRMRRYQCEFCGGWHVGHAGETKDGKQ